MTPAVIFDVDGTLLDTVDLHADAWVKALQYFGHSINFQDMRVQIGKGGDQVLLGLLPANVLEDRGDDIKNYRSRLFKRDYLSKAQPFPGVRELFEKLRSSGHRIALASSGTAEEVEEYREIAGISDLIDAATSSGDASRSKPFPDIFAAALEKLQVTPGQALVVGDTPYDAEAARALHLPAIGVLCGGFSRDALVSAGCTAVYSGPKELLEKYPTSLGRETSPEEAAQITRLEDGLRAVRHAHP